MSAQLDAEFIQVTTGSPRSGASSADILSRDVGLKAGAKIKTVAGANLTLDDTYHAYIIDFTNASGCVVTIPDYLRPDFYCGISQGAAGQVQVSAVGDVALNEPNGQFKTAAQYVMLSLIAFARNSFRLFGSTAP